MSSSEKKQQTKNDQPLVSIVMPVYNGENFVAEAIESVINQTYKNWELIIVDDGSTDRSREVISKYLCDARIKVIKHGGNLGIAKARNTGIERSQGSYIAFLDQDDLWLPSKTEKSLSKFKYSEAIGLVHTGLIMESTEDQKKITKSGYSKRSISRKIKELFLNEAPFYTASTVMVRKQCFDKLGLMDESLFGSDDKEMWIRIMVNRYKIGCVEEALVIKREHASNTSKDPRRLKDSIKVSNLICSKYPSLRKYKQKRLSNVHYSFACSEQRTGKLDLLWTRKHLIKAVQYDRFNWRAYILILASFCGPIIFKLSLSFKDLIRDLFRGFIARRVQ